MSEAQPQNLFHNVNVVNIYQAPRTSGESRTETIPVKVTATEKRQAQDLAFKLDVSCSDLYRTAGAVFCEFHSHSEKLMKYSKAVKSILDSLP